MNIRVISIASIIVALLISGSITTSVQAKKKDIKQLTTQQIERQIKALKVRKEKRCAKKRKPKLCKKRFNKKIARFKRELTRRGAPKKQDITVARVCKKYEEFIDDYKDLMQGYATLINKFSKLSRTQFDTIKERARDIALSPLDVPIGELQSPKSGNTSSACDVKKIKEMKGNINQYFKGTDLDYDNVIPESKIAYNKLKNMINCNRTPPNKVNELNNSLRSAKENLTQPVFEIWVFEVQTKKLAEKLLPVLTDLVEGKDIKAEESDEYDTLYTLYTLSILTELCPDLLISRPKL